MSKILERESSGDFRVPGDLDGPRVRVERGRRLRRVALAGAEFVEVVVVGRILVTGHRLGDDILAALGNRQRLPRNRLLRGLAAGFRRRARLATRRQRDGAEAERLEPFTATAVDRLRGDFHA